MRVTWVSPSYGYGGDLLYFGGIFAAFCKHFPATTILVDRTVDYRGAEGLPLQPGLECWHFGGQRTLGQAAYDVSYAIPKPGLIPALLRSQPQALVVIEFTLPALIATALAWFRRDIALLLLVESDPALRGAKSNPVVRAIKRWACRRADAIQTCNAAGKRFLIEELRVPPAKVRVAPYLTSCPPHALQPMHKRDDGRVTILFANSLVSRKGADRLLSALAQLPPAIAAKVAVTIVGEGPERPRLEAMASQLASIPTSFVGAKPYAELGSDYAAADILAIPTLADYRSLAGFEGLGYGLALLASRADGASEEILDGGRTGLSIDPNDPATIAAAITQMVEHPDQLAAYQHNAKALFEDRFSYAQIASHLADGLVAALDGRRANP